jgi:hypothetical protein
MQGGERVSRRNKRNFLGLKIVPPVQSELAIRKEYN